MNKTDSNIISEIYDKISSIDIDSTKYAFPFWTGHAIGHWSMKDEWERLYKEVKVFWAFYTALIGFFVFVLCGFLLKYFSNYYPWLGKEINTYSKFLVVCIGLFFSYLTFKEAREENIAIWNRTVEEDLKS